MEKRTTEGALLFIAFVAVLMAISCKKDKTGTPGATSPVMEYFNFGDREIRENTDGLLMDVNHDNRYDLAFTTLLVGDPLNQVDKHQFLISTNIDVNLPVNGDEEIPVMNQGESIAVGNFNGYHWFELSSILLVQKIIHVSVPVRWEGLWKNVSHKYIPYQVIKNGNRYNGWVEVSVDITSEKIVVHKAAISKEPNRIVKAGD